MVYWGVRYKSNEQIPLFIPQSKTSVKELHQVVALLTGPTVLIFRFYEAAECRRANANNSTGIETSERQYLA